MQRVQQLYEQHIKLLSLTEVHQLLNIIQIYLKKIEADKQVHRQWSEIAGIAPYPLVGQDAQTWVSRHRLEGDAEREKQWANK